MKACKEYLDQNKIKAWFDENNLQHSGMLHPQLANGIQRSEKFLCFITEKYDISDNCFMELSWALTLKKTIIAVMMENVDIRRMQRIGMIINPILRISFSEDNYQEKIVKAILNEGLSNIINNPSSIPPSSSPPLPSRSSSSITVKVKTEIEEVEQVNAFLKTF